MGAQGKGRAIGVGSVRFSGMVTPATKLIEYEIDLKRVINRKIVMLTADGILKADGEPIYKAEDLRVVVEGAS
jgi:3-hydroxyacyl-[acyl-carrier protein] dehydratase/trans-2-decenoyl-[acyl-carrier protein] isomerase